MNILIVDNELIVIEALKHRVDWRHLGFEKVFTCCCMKDALEIMKHNTIHLLISDIEMPHGSGLDLYEQVRLYYPRTECIFVTCYDDYKYMRQAMQLGSFDYILKPIDYGELSAVVRKVHIRIKATFEKYPLTTSRAKIQPDEPVAGNDYVSQIMQYIKDHLSEPISITELSESLHLSSQYTMRIFKKNMNQSILTYITEQRIELAKELLTYSAFPVTDIAERVGIHNLSYFIKLFKKSTNETPLSYRNKTAKIVP